MADLTALRASPLAGRTADLAAAAVGGAFAVRVAELPFRTMLSLRVDPRTPTATALATRLGSLPGQVGVVGGHDRNSVLWLGPDEWLVISEQPADELIVDLTKAAEPSRDYSLVDVSANRTILVVTGAAARRTLQKGCPLDLHPRAFGPGQAVTTTLARIPLLLWQVAADSFWLLPRSSFADYVASWLLDASAEFAGAGWDAGY